MWNSYTKYIYDNEKYKLSDTTESHVHQQLSACNHFALSPFAIKSIANNTPTLNKISSKAKVIQQRSREDSSIEMSLQQHEDLIPDVNSSSTLKPYLT